MLCRTKAYFLTLIFSLFFLVSACQKRCGEIEFVSPTLFGFGVELKKACWVDSATIIQKGKRKLFMPINRKTKRIWLKFKWDKEREYTLVLRSKREILKKKIVPKAPTFFVLNTFLLGKPKVKIAEINKWSKKLYEMVKISKKGIICVGGFDGRLLVFDKFGDLLWRRSFPEGVIKSLAFSEDGNWILVGESSVWGNVYAINLKNGKIAWTYTTSDDLGKPSDNLYSHNVKVSSIVVRDGIVYVSAKRAWQAYIKENGKKIPFWFHLGKIYAFYLKSGKVLFKFPKNSLLDTSALKLCVDSAGRYIVFGGWGGSANGRIKQRYPENGLYILDAKTGSLIWKVFIKPLYKFGFNSTSLGSSCNISKNGKFVSCCSSDGRAFLFDNDKSVRTKKACLLYEKTIAKPFVVSGIPIYTYGAKTLVDDFGNLFLITGRTFVSPGFYGEAPSAKHPLENSIFEFGKKGQLLWSWHFKAPIESYSLSRNGRYLCLVLSHNYVDMTKDMAGVYLFDRISRKLLWLKKFHGIGVFCDISKDGSMIAAIEAPIDMNPDPQREEILGRHRLYMLR